MHLRTAYQPVCLSSTMLQVNYNILYLYVCMYVSSQEFIFCNIDRLIFFFLRLHIYGTVYIVCFCIVFLFVTQYCFA